MCDCFSAPLLVSCGAIFCCYSGAMCCAEAVRPKRDGGEQTGDNDSENAAAAGCCGRRRHGRRRRRRPFWKKKKDAGEDVEVEGVIASSSDKSDTLVKKADGGDGERNRRANTAANTDNDSCATSGDAAAS